MLWLNNKIRNLVETISPKDVAFLLISSLEINKKKRSTQKAQAALEIISLHPSFKKYFFEFYINIGNKLRVFALRGFEKKLISNYYGKSVPKTGAIHHAFISGKINFSSNLSSVTGRRSELLKKSNIKSSLIIPISHYGVISVDRLDNKRFEDYEFMLLKSFVYDVVAPSLELAVDNEKNMDASIKDFLTNVYNHGYFKLELERQCNNALRGGYNINLAMIDIDYFKHYNDLHGHPAGDKVLTGVANLLKNNLRAGDIIARYGGEEFAVIMFNAKLKNAERKAESLRKIVSAHHFNKENLQPNGNLTISIGLANLPKQARNAKELIDKADKALYHSKKTGKNKLTVYGSF